MRALLVLVFGALLGAGATMAYVVFAGTPIGAGEPLPKHPPITLALGAPFLEQAMVRAAREVPELGDDVSVTPRDGDLVIGFGVRVAGQPARALIVLRPAIVRGKLAFDVTSTGLGGMPLPKLGPAVEKQVDAHVRALMKNLPIVVTGVAVERARGLIVTGNVDLARLEALLQN